MDYISTGRYQKTLLGLSRGIIYVVLKMSRGGIIREASHEKTQFAQSLGKSARDIKKTGDDASVFIFPPANIIHAQNLMKLLFFHSVHNILVFGNVHMHTSSTSGFEPHS